jgi:urease accessory protein
VRNYAAYPFHVTRPFYFDAGWPELPTLLLQSVSGGLFQGDRLRLEVSVGEGAAAHLATQAATKIHSMRHEGAVQAIQLDVEEGGYLEFLADAAILFPGSRLESTTTVTLGPRAVAIVAESFVWHDPTGDPEPRFAELAGSIEAVDANGRLLALDRYRAERPNVNAASRAFWRQNRAHGALYVLAPNRDPNAIVLSLRTALDGAGGCYAAVSTLPNGAGAYIRAVAADSGAMRTAQETAWRAARAAITGRATHVSWRK